MAGAGDHGDCCSTVGVQPLDCTATANQAALQMYQTDDAPLTFELKPLNVATGAYGTALVSLDGTETDDGTTALPEHPEDRCIVNDDCGFTGICLDGGCYFPCDAIGACPPDQACSGGQCMPTATPEVTCTFNGECGPGRVCIEGQCFATCEESLDCGDNLLCDEGLCVADTSPVIQCSGTGACGVDEGCFDGKCLALCDEARPCASDAICQYGYCHQKVECTLSDECSSELQCLDGDCASVSLP